MSIQLAIAWPGASPWLAVSKGDPRARALADRHYSRQKIGSAQIMPPGQTLVLLTPCARAVFGWHRPHPSSGIVQLNGLNGWTCTIFRNEGAGLSSDLILAAERELAARFDCGPDGMLTYVWDSKIRGVNPGCCYKFAGWVIHPIKPRSADDAKTLLWKPFHLAGLGPGSEAACPTS